MKNYAKIIAALAILALAVVPFCACDGSDADVARSGACTTGGFSDNGGGWLKITLTNTSNVEDETVSINVVDYNNPSNILAHKDATVPKGDGVNPGIVTVELNFSYGNSGTKYVNVEVYDGTSTLISPACENGVQIEVSHSVWKNVSSYIVIAVVVIIIIIVIVLYLRSTKKTKADRTMAEKTFTQMHEAKKSKKGGAAAPAAPAEKKAYVASGNKKKRK